VEVGAHPVPPPFNIIPQFGVGGFSIWGELTEGLQDETVLEKAL